MDIPRSDGISGKRKERAIPEAEEVKDVILRHAELQTRYKGEYIGIREMRKHIAWYTAGYPHSAKFRGRINEIEGMEELRKGIEEIFSPINWSGACGNKNSCLLIGCFKGHRRIGCFG